jgi:hypothetical protein
MFAECRPHTNLLRFRAKAARKCIAKFPKKIVLGVLKHVKKKAVVNYGCVLWTFQ